MPSPTVAEVSAAQSWKTEVPSEVTVSGRTTEVKPDDWKALLPMVVTPEGMSMAVSAVQFWNALLPISFSPAGNVTSASAVHP